MTKEKASKEQIKNYAAICLHHLNNLADDTFNITFNSMGASDVPFFIGEELKRIRASYTNTEATITQVQDYLYEHDDITDFTDIQYNTALIRAEGESRAAFKKRAARSKAAFLQIETDDLLAAQILTQTVRRVCREKDYYSFANLDQAIALMEGEFNLNIDRFDNIRKVAEEEGLLKAFKEPSGERIYIRELHESAADFNKRISRNRRKLTPREIEARLEHALHAHLAPHLKTVAEYVEVEAEIDKLTRLYNLKIDKLTRKRKIVLERETRKLREQLKPTIADDNVMSL